VKGKLYSCDINGNVISVRKSLSSVSREKMLDYTCKYAFGADGSIKVSFDGETFLENKSFLPRLGFEFTTDTKKFKYFGYGPYESYEDKRLASRVGLFRTTATENFEHYVRPQENSAHYGCRFADVTSKSGHGLYFSAESFSFSVSHFSPEYLTGVAHDFELVPERETTVVIDYRTSGIGSDSCGPHLAEEFRIKEEDIKFKFFIKPVFTGNILPFKEYRK
jgi:beta-galactosidase